MRQGKTERKPMSNWQLYDYELDGLRIPAAGGVYAIYGDGELIYIGESDSVKRRLSSHQIRYSYSNYIITPWGNFQSVKIKVRRCLRFAEWAMIERRLIRRLKPSGNTKGTGRQRRNACA